MECEKTWICFFTLHFFICFCLTVLLCPLRKEIIDRGMQFLRLHAF